jgi:putative alpha-1,2-mannosidase
MVIDSLYHDQPDGYAGNEDCGQMSAWVIWSISGLYPVNPASGKYMFGSPAANEVTIKTAAGKFTIKADNNSSSNVYIQSVKLNGKPYYKNYITHADMLRGGTLEMVMGAHPAKYFKD